MWHNIYPLYELKDVQKWLLHVGWARNVSQTLGDPTFRMQKFASKKS